MEKIEDEHKKETRVLFKVMRVTSSTYEQTLKLEIFKKDV